MKTKLSILLKSIFTLSLITIISSCNLSKDEETKGIQSSSPSGISAKVKASKF